MIVVANTSPVCYLLLIGCVVASPDVRVDAVLSHLHAGEREAILLAEYLRADLIILDDKAARRSAAARGCG